MRPLEVSSPSPIASELFTDPSAAVARLEEIHERNTAFLRQRFAAYASGEPLETRVRAVYPLVRITTATHARVDSRLSYGFVHGPGVYETSVTRPDLFRAYYTKQIGLLIENHGVPVEIGESDEPIPVHFAYRHSVSIGDLGAPTSRRPLRDFFDAPDLAVMDDAIVNGTLPPAPSAAAPLALFRAARVDYSLQRLHHYTGTDPEHFQNFVIFTNYQFYADAFVRVCRERIARGEPDCGAFVEPGNVITPSARPAATSAGAPPTRAPQMPAWHLVGPDRDGITMINIGNGPSNAHGPCRRDETARVADARPLRRA